MSNQIINKYKFSRKNKNNNTKTKTKIKKSNLDKIQIKKKQYTFKNNKKKGGSIQRIKNIVSNNTKKIGQGGQSSIYKHNNNNKVIRTISSNGKYEFEIAEYITDNIIIPHNCVNLVKIIENYENNNTKNKYQIMDKYNGDLSQIINKLDDENINKCKFQILIACILLTKYKLINFDIKPENILYKYNEIPYKLIYKIDDNNIFQLNTNYLVAITDYGKVFNIEDIINEEFEIKQLLSDNSINNCTLLTNINNFNNIFKYEIYINQDQQKLSDIKKLKNEIIKLKNEDVQKNTDFIIKQLINHIKNFYLQYNLTKINNIINTNTIIITI